MTQFLVFAQFEPSNIGNLALSRALGDFVFKKNEKKSAEEQIVTAYPDVTVEKITADHEFLVLACDGIWDVLSNQEVVDFIRGRLAAKMEPHVVRNSTLGDLLINEGIRDWRVTLAFVGGLS